jgi:dipeptide/tripeptide permease
MRFINRNWTPETADEWKKEDYISILLSSFSYIFLMIGTALAFLFIPVGFILLGIGIVLSLLMFWVIDPKLKVISTKYEKKQKDYLLKLDEIQKWDAEK